MLYWFFVKVLGPLARHRFSPKAFGVDNIPRQGGGIIAANHLSVIDDGVIPLTWGKAIISPVRGSKGRSRNGGLPLSVFSLLTGQEELLLKVL